MNMFETAMVNEPRVFEPLNFYCIKLHVYVFFCQDSGGNYGLNCPKPYGNSLCIQMVDILVS